MTAEPLPETAAVRWRRRVDARHLARRGRLWTFNTVAHSVPFAIAGGVLFVLEPLTAPVGLMAVALGWGIPALQARRGAHVVRPRRRDEVVARRRRDEAVAARRKVEAVSPRRRRGARNESSGQPERVAAGLLGDLVGHEERALHARAGLVLETGSLGVWLLGEAGALLVRPGGRRVDCWCVRADDPALPPGDRIAHLLLALRTDEQGFATVANLAFSGARRRVRRRLPRAMRPALDAAAAAARAAGSRPTKGRSSRPSAA